jgi:hypothetical protein
MATRKKEKAATEPRGVQAPKKLSGATLMHVHYHPEARLVRATVQQDVSIVGASERVGRDVDFPIDDLPAEIRNCAEQFITLLGAHVGANPLPLPAKAKPAQ